MTDTSNPAGVGKSNYPKNPDSWVLVPREPTKKMHKAAWDACDNDMQPRPDWPEFNAKLYRAMLAAAPVPSHEHPIRDSQGGLSSTGDRGEGVFRARIVHCEDCYSQGTVTTLDRYKSVMSSPCQNCGAPASALRWVHAAPAASLPPARVEEAESLRNALLIARNYLLNEIGDAKDRYAADDLDIIDRALGKYSKVTDTDTAAGC